MLNDRDYMRPGRGRGWSYHMSPSGSIVKALIWANVLVFLLVALDKSVMTLLWLQPDAIRAYEFWRFGTYMFVHGGLGHLFVNMWGLYLFGRWLEERLGSHAFLYLSAGRGRSGPLHGPGRRGVEKQPAGGC